MDWMKRNETKDRDYRKRKDRKNKINEIKERKKRKKRNEGKKMVEEKRY